MGPGCFARVRGNGKPASPKRGAKTPSFVGGSRAKTSDKDTVAGSGVELGIFLNTSDTRPRGLFLRPGYASMHVQQSSRALQRLKVRLSDNTVVTELLLAVALKLPAIMGSKIADCPS
jgi:hypothetical protein